MKLSSINTYNPPSVISTTNSKTEVIKSNKIENGVNILNHMQNAGNLNKTIAFGAGLTHLTDISRILSDVKLFDNSHLEMVSRIFQKIGVNDIEYITPKADDTVSRLFVKCKNFVYNMTLGKVSDDVMTGFVSKEYNNGHNELFMLRGEFLETNKSKKLQLSFMPIVQTGLEDSSKVKPKHLKEITGDITSESVGQEAVAAWAKTGESYSSFDILGGLLGSGGSRSVSYSPALINKESLGRINMGIQLSNSDIRKNVTFSIDKETGFMSESGAVIGKNSPKIAKEHSGWDIVAGPYGDIETPKHINITEEGIDPNSIKSIIVAPLIDENIYWEKFARTQSHISNEDISGVMDKPIKEADDLRGLISVLTRELNGETLNWYKIGKTNFLADWSNNSNKKIKDFFQNAVI